jgi:hypothetical protein
VAATVLAAGLTLVAIPSGAAPAACHAASGPQTVPLVELFTSEGCNSCPPADRWLSARFPPHFSAGDAQPPALALAYHVDYWDRLGWRDRFASAQFTQRQYGEMRANGATFVYTPQVLVQGHDAPEWKLGRVSESLAAIARRPARASIALDIVAMPDSLELGATAMVSDAAARKHAVLWLAYTDSGHTTDVAAGENRGVRLAHDHVVRSLHGPYAVDSNGAAAPKLDIALPRDPGRGAVLIAFVQDMKNGDILQALALPACGAT